MDVSIIIVNYNTFELTKNCIQSIYDNTKQVTFEIILIDNASKDAEPSQFLDTFPQLVLITNGINYGFGIANNQGMMVARGKYFLLLNPDTYLLNNAIDVAYFYAERKKEYQAFGADIRDESMLPLKGYYVYQPFSVGRTLFYSFVLDNLLLNKVYVLLKSLRKQSDDHSKIGGLYGAYIFLRRDVYEDVGGFDPDFFMYCEETEWFRNRITKKYNVDICWDAKIVHLEAKSSAPSPLKLGNVLSYYLYWYKVGFIHYLIYSIFSYLNIIPNFFGSFLMRAEERKRSHLSIKYRLLCLSKVLIDIPKFSNKFASRDKPLSF